MEYYIHHVPGRLRVKIPTLKYRPGDARHIQALLDLYGVTEVSIKVTTGSVVVRYNPEYIQAEQLLSILADNGYFDNTRTTTIDDQLRNASSKTAEKIGKFLFGWGVSKALEANGLSLLAALI